MTIVTSLAISTLAAVFSALITYFIKSASEKKKLDEMTSIMGTSLKELRQVMDSLVENKVLTHERVHHRYEMVSVAKSEVTSHEQRCDAFTRFESISNELKVMKNAMIFLVTKSNGDPKQMGLI